ncbi:MAG: hypothetical protein OXF08_03530 [Bacteroidetes bacterium]|nr:hypothetical protein [Bacteroidota bacterium]
MSYVLIQHIKVSLDFGSGVVTVGDLVIRDQQVYFEYHTDFILKGYELSPFRLP